MIASYCLAIMELYLFMSYLINFYTCHRKCYLALIVPRVAISALGPFNQDVRYRRMVRSLLDIEVSSIGALGLVCLSQHRVQRLFKELSFMD